MTVTEIGAPIQVRLGTLRREVEDHARRYHVSQAEAVRQLVERALQAAR